MELMNSDSSLVSHPTDGGPPWSGLLNCLHPLCSAILDEPQEGLCSSSIAEVREDLSISQSQDNGTQKKRKKKKKKKANHTRWTTTIHILKRAGTWHANICAECSCHMSVQELLQWGARTEWDSRLQRRKRKEFSSSKKAVTP
jgi:hypothetical protein